MRNHILLLSTALLLVACADDQHSTAPAGSRSAPNRSAAGDVGTSAQPINPQAKPTDQVGFTSVSTVTSAIVTAQGVINPGYGIATCPAGTTAISGGYNVDSNQLDARVYYDGPDGANGWKVKMVVDNNGTVDYHVLAVCAK
jgi:hypothetical protein